MKVTLFTILFFSISTIRFAAAQDSGTNGIKFEHGSFAELKAKAVLEKKPIFIDAFTTWCGPCKWMSKTIFTQEKVGDFYNQNFVNAKIDMEKGEGIELATRFGVQAYPTLLFVDAEGNIQHRSVGAREGDSFIELGKQAINPELNLVGLSAKFKSNPASYDVAYKYMAALKDAYSQDSKDQKTVFDSYFATQEKATWIEQRNWRMLFDFARNPQNPVFLNMKENRALFSTRYSADSVDSKLKEVYYDQIQSAAYQQDIPVWEETKKTIESLQLKGSDRVVALTTIPLAGENPVAICSNTFDFMNQFGTKDARELNQFAWRVYEISTDKKQLLAAESWAKQATEIEPADPMIADTYAALLFKNGKKSLAKAQAEKAISLGKTAGADMSGTVELLAKIKDSLKPKPAPKGKK